MRLMTMCSAMVGPRWRFDRATTYQATFAWRTWEGSKVAISLEVPFLASPAFTVATAGGTLPKEYAALYLTPGVRLTVHPNGLVCPCCCSRSQTARPARTPPRSPRTVQAR